MNKGRWIEVFLIQLLIYFLLWQWDDYLATVLSLIFGAICFLILVVSIIVEFIEPTRVPTWYFTTMAASVFAPIFAAGIFIFTGGEILWLTGALY